MWRCCGRFGWWWCRYILRIMPETLQGVWRPLSSMQALPWPSLPYLTLGASWSRLGWGGREWALCTVMLYCCTCSRYWLPPDTVQTPKQHNSNAKGQTKEIRCKINRGSAVLHISFLHFLLVSGNRRWQSLLFRFFEIRYSVTHHSLIRC